MRKPTDYMMTCPVLVSAADVGYRDAAMRALRSGAAIVVALVIAASIAGAMLHSVAVGIGLWLGFLVASLRFVRTSRHLDITAVVECYRAWAAAGGRYAPHSAIAKTDLPWLGRVYLLAAVPFLSVYGCVFADRRVTEHAARISTMTTLESDAIMSRCEQALHLYLCYPDRTFTAASGHGGVWFPDQTLDERREAIAGLVQPVKVYALSGIVAAVVLSLFALQLPWWLAVVAIVFLAGGAISSCGILLQAPQLVQAALMEPLVRLAAEEQVLLPPAANEWEDCVQRVANSTYELDGVPLAEHLFIGWIQPNHTDAWHPFRRSGAGDTPSPMPLLVHRSVLRANCHITGATQSGKSITGETGMLLQFIRPYLVAQRDDQGVPKCGLDGEPLWCPSEGMPILILDLKGDQALYNTVREECARLGRKFQAFTLDQGYASAHFAPLEDLNASTSSAIERTEILIDGLSMYYGPEYGKVFFAKQNRDLLLLAQRSGKTPPTSFEQLYKLLLDEVEPARHRDVLELLSSVFALAQYPVLAPAPPRVDQIRFPDVIRDCSVAFFKLGARTSTMSIRDTARLALLNFMTASADWNDRKPLLKLVRVWVEAVGELALFVGVDVPKVPGGTASTRKSLLNEEEVDDEP